MITAPGVNEFIDLSDAPHSYAGQATKVVKVNAGETAVEFGTGGGSGTVTEFFFTDANGVDGTVLTSTTTPTLSISLGAITPSSVTSPGDIEITDTVKGVIIKSANGTRWRVGVSNTGELTVDSL